MKRPQLDYKTYWMLKKEIKEVMRSRWLLVGFMISPLFAWVFEGFFLSFIVTQTVEEPELVYITNDDHGLWGNTLYNAIEGFKDDLKISDLVDITKQQGDQLVENKTVTVWVYIPANFTRDLNQTTESTLIIWVNSASLRASTTASFIDVFSREVINAEITIRDLSVSTFTISPEATFGHQLAIFLVMITSVLAPSPYVSKSFSGERERHTLEALLVVPMSRIKILGSKVVAGILLTMIYSVFTVIGILFYNWWIILRASAGPAAYAAFFIDLYTVDVASIPLIFACQFLVLLCAIGIGIVISTLAKDQASSESINNLVLLVPTFVVGILGFAGSISQYTGLFGLFILAIPFTHAVIILNSVLSGVWSPIGILGNVLYLVVFTLVFLIIGAKLFEREAIIS
ncbi:MAG: ABC transporter permease [Candidatus Thorarchaeota archaeon]|jgi:ABC-2 type transport system permease protein